MHVAFTSFHEESPVPGYSLRYLCHFADESMKEWNLCQMEHVLHSMDLSMEVSQSFSEKESALSAAGFGSYFSYVVNEY